MQPVADKMIAPGGDTMFETPYWISDNSVTPPADLSRLVHAAEVVVVGGGVMGVATTYWLARLGVNVLLLEASELAGGASGRNAGFMLCGSSPLEDSSLIRAILEEENIQADFLETGHLALASSPAIVERIQEEIAKKLLSGPPLHWLDREQCEDLMGLRISHRFLGGRWFPSGRTIHPVRFVVGLANASARRGTVMAFRTRALSLVRRGIRSSGIDVITSRGRVRARHVVLACNVKTALLLPEIKQVLTPTRGQVLCTSPVRPVFNVGLAVDWGTLYWRQVKDGVIVLGGYHNLDPAAERSSKELLNPKIQSALSQFLPDAFPGFPEFSVQRRWSGIMDESADGKPIVGRWPGERNIWVIAGFGGHGFPPAVGAAKALAESITEGQESSALAALTPARFADRLRNSTFRRKHLQMSAKEAK